MWIFEVLMDIVGHRMARWLLPAISFGTIKVDDLMSVRTGFNWLGFQRTDDNVLLCSSDTAAWIGVFAWILVLIVVIGLGLLG